MLNSFKAPTRISQEKYVRVGCSGLFSEQCNANGTQLQCRAAYHPVSPLMNINQRSIFTDHQVYTCKDMQLKATYFWTGKYFLCHCLVEENQSRKEQLVE